VYFNTNGHNQTFLFSRRYTHLDTGQKRHKYEYKYIQDLKIGIPRHLSSGFFYNDHDSGEENSSCKTTYSTFLCFDFVGRCT
jgi:hypothetical protein